MSNLRDWFHLRETRHSFKPTPLPDRGVIFCHQSVQKDIHRAITKAYATGETLKLLLWGDWGVGKTHTLRHIDYWLEQNREEFPAKTIYVEIGDIDPTDTFAKIHKDLLDGIGLDKVLTLAFAFQASGKSLLSELERIGIPPTIRAAMNKFFVHVPGNTPPEVVVTAWNYLRGDDVGRLGSSIGLPRQLVDGKEFYYVLAALGYLFQQVDKCQLIFLVDEAAKLESVRQEKERHWINVNKLILDQDNKYFGFVYTVSGKSDGDLPRALFEPQLENRLGNRKIELKNLLPADVEKFLSQLSDAFVDKDAAEADAAVNLIGRADYSRSTYPLTPEAMIRFKEYFQRTQENSKPRDITDKLDDAAFDAMESGKRLIDEDVLQNLGM